MKNILDFNNGKMSDKAFTQNLLISVVSILLCIGLLCSVTYAWFSKEAEVGNHIITSGNFSLDATVIYITPETSEAVAVAVDTLSDGSMSCILEKKGTTYIVVLSMTEEANVKGYCAISIGNDVNEITVPMSRAPEIGVDSLSFTITTAEDNTVVCFTPKWGYPAASTLTDGASIVLEGDSIDDGEYIISILGDSISTYEGYISTGNATYYPTNYLKSVDDTWWMQLITELNAKLGVNESWSGSFVSAMSGDRVPMASVDRISKLDDNGTPDVIVFFGGTNDIAFRENRPMGTFDPASVPSSADLSATEWASFADGYVEVILRIKHYYPDAEIIVVLPTLNKSYYDVATLEEYNSIMRSICRHYGIEYVDLVAEGFTTSMLGDATHPNATGMDFITAAVKKLLVEEHTHSYTESITKPTCQEQGYTVYACECGDRYVDNYVSATGEHIYVDGKCTMCGKDEEEIVVKRPVALIEKATLDLPAVEISASPAVHMPTAPYAYTDTSRFAGKKIIKLGIPVKSVDASNGTPVFTLSVVKTNTSGTAYTYVAQYKLEIPAFDSTNDVNDWVYVDLSEYNIVLAEDETLAFGAPSDTVSWAYVGKSIDKKYTFRSTASQWNVSNNNSIIFDVYAEEVLTFTDVDGVKTATFEAPVFSDLRSLLATGALSTADKVSLKTAPFAYSTSKNIYEGKKITKIGIPVMTVNALDENQTFTLSIVRTDSKAYVYVEQYVLTLPLDQLGSSKTVNRWIYVDVSNLNITVGENETLAFGSPNDTVVWGYTWQYPDSAYYFRGSAGDWNNDYGGIFFDVYFEDSITYDDYLDEIRAEEERIQNEALLKEILNGKSLSILGDSISTFAGYSNNTDYNSTIGDNAIYYNGTNAIVDVNETWWMQTINRVGMTLNVNNSWSGDKVTERGLSRAVELDNNNDAPPDIIAVYFGVNDFRVGVSLEVFAEQYANMVSAMKEKYPEAEICLFSLVYTSRVNSGINPNDIELYNEVVQQIANETNCCFVDLYNNSGINEENFSEYMADGDLHPNYFGMDCITQCFIDALVERYVSDN